MNQLQIVSADFVYSIWDKVAGFLGESASVGTNDCTVEQLKTVLARGLQTLIVIVKDDIITGAGTVELINYPNARVAFITSMGGYGVIDTDTATQFEHWAKAQGATKVQALARPAQARLYRQKANFSADTFLVEKLL